MRLGDQYSTQTLDEATNFIWRIFQQDTTPADRKNVEKVSLFIDDMDGVAYASNNEIHVSARYIQSYSGDVKVEITGVLYHEMTHVWQWNGNGQAPGGLIEESRHPKGQPPSKAVGFSPIFATCHHLCRQPTPKNVIVLDPYVDLEWFS
ncbi:Plant basic secretory protein (BSP) family protein [Forsythia ovata]|uniref:Plant basic secretory protein (BSP) family protein n=1 Tax=Forsythia ovata TaxID=205694 RepID=A0ABD1VKW7_9LAMI